MAFSINGLSSGLDTAQIIKDMMAIERLPYTNLETKKTDLQTQQGVFRTINTKFKSLEAALNSLKNPGDYSQLKATSTGTSVSATAAAGASAGSYNLNVTQLATSNVIRISSKELLGDIATNTATNIDTNLKIGDYTLKSSDVEAINKAGAILNDAGDIETPGSNEDKMKELAKIINRESAAGDNSSGAKATVMQQTSGTFELMLTSTETGVNSKVKLTSSGTDLAQIANKAGENAKFTLNNIDVERSSNEIDDLISDVSFKLTNEGNSTVTVAQDTDTLVHNMKIFVTAYNDLIALVKDNLSKPADEDKTNPLQGNSLLKQISDDLYSMFNAGVVTGTVSNNGVTRDVSTFMQDLGLSIDKGATSASGMTGKITFDEAKFTEMLTTDPNKVINVLTKDKPVLDGSGNPVKDVNGKEIKEQGIFTKLSSIMNQYTSTVNGMLASKITGYDSEIKVANERMESMNMRLEAKEIRLKMQFSNMEVMLSSLKSEQSWLKSQFDSLLNSNK